MHPNPECIYEKNGVLVSEDEEDCFDEYKLKGLIKESATFECPSPDHNKISKAILSTVYTGGLILERILNLVQTCVDYYSSTFIPLAVLRNGRLKSDLRRFVCF